MDRSPHPRPWREHVLAQIGLLAVPGLIVGLAACSTRPEAVHVSGERDGLTLTADVTGTGASIIVESVLRNDREEAVHVVPDQCGRVVDVELERSSFEPDGATWDGSVQAVKELILRDQRGRQDPDFFHPRRVGGSSSDTPECVRPERVTRLEPGTSIAERWELPFGPQYGQARALAELGSDGTRIGLEAVEAREPDQLEFLDILQDEDEDEHRAGRVVRVELATSAVAELEPTSPVTGPSMGELYDRLIAHEPLRDWILAQPAESWRLALLQPALPEAGRPYSDLRLRLVTTSYERAATVVARPDGSSPQVTLPAEQDRSRVFERRPGTLPPGIALMPETDFAISDDLMVGDVNLPSGRVVVGEYLFDLEPLGLEVAPGAYPVHATLARDRDAGWESVSFASIVFSDAPTLRWQLGDSIAVDGGSATIISPESRDELRALFDADEDAWMDKSEEIFDARTAHEYLATEFELTPELDLAEFSSGLGDGGYPVYVGYDASGKPTRVVVDFYLLHLAWPDAR